MDNYNKLIELFAGNWEYEIVQNEDGTITRTDLQIGGEQTYKDKQDLVESIIDLATHEYDSDEDSATQDLFVGYGKLATYELKCKGKWND